MIVEIISPSGLYYGIYNDSGGWKQSDFENPPTHLAILFEIPSTAGRYNADIIAQGDETFARTESVFNVKFEPETEGFFSENFTTSNGVGKVEGSAMDLIKDFEDDTDRKIIDWYK
jgi:hypothetical protein